jgi:hypothetical protein
MRTFEDEAGMTRKASAALHAAPSGSVGARTVLPGRALLPWRALVALAVLSLALGTSLYEGLLSSRSSSVAPAVGRAHAAFSRKGLLSLPLAAQGPVSAALGADSAAYRVSASGGGFTASSPAQHLRSSFTSSGVSVASGATRLGLSLCGVGYGSSLTALGGVAPRADGNRVVYAHRGLSEWFANGPLGLEQGFTIARAPAGHALGPLTLSVALSGNAHAALAKDGQSLTLTRAGETVLRYTGLSATDARGHTLRSWLQLQGGRLLLRVDTKGAHYPLRIDPFIQQGGKLTGSGESGKGDFGYSVALSSDGNTALIGAPYNNGEVGAAWVFTRENGQWAQQGNKLTGGGEKGEGEFGRSVALSSDGNTALIGGYEDNKEVGAAWVFTRENGQWAQQGSKLTGGGESGKGGFGYSVALSSDGNTALIGGPDDAAAWVFTRSGFGSSYTEQEKFTGGGESSGYVGFSESVALSSDGNTALISGPNNNTSEGAVWVFTRSGFGSPYTEQEKFRGGGEIGKGHFGFDVALSSDGNTALIGAPYDNGEVGAAWIFTRSGFGSPYTEQEKHTGGGGSEGRFGYSVALSSEGDTALIGGGFEGAGPFTGTAWVFTRSGFGSPYTEQEKLTGGGASGEPLFGLSVALSAEGNTALIGGPRDNSDVGAAWVFETRPTVTTGSATEVTPTTATLNATVNPSGREVSECVFEYGTTEAYGSFAKCSSLPGSGSSPVAVSASPNGLSAETTYHFRISATNEDGTSKGSDETFTTLLTSASGSTENAKEPAKATDKELSATASGGTGTVTVGDYGSAIGGAPLSKSTGEYIDVYHSGASKFTSIEVKDCELGGGKSLWWYDPATGWEPISEPPATYTEAGPQPCITVTFTESTRPNIAQLTGTRFGTRFGDAVLEEEAGKCEPGKDANYTEAKCAIVAEKKGKPDHKGKYEWYADPVGCFPMKHGFYGEGCKERLEKKGKGKGSSEAGTGEFESTGKATKFEIKSIGTLECKESTAKGAMTGPKTGWESVTYTGCALASRGECESSGQTAGTITTNKLGVLIEEGTEEKTSKEVVPKAVVVEFFPLGSSEYQVYEPIMTFRCGGEEEEYTLQGDALGQSTKAFNAMSSTSESVFSPEVGIQELETVTQGKAYETTLTATEKVTSAQAFEVNTDP